MRTSQHREPGLARRLSDRLRLPVLAGCCLLGWMLWTLGMPPLARGMPVPVRGAENLADVFAIASNVCAGRVSTWLARPFNAEWRDEPLGNLEIVRCYKGKLKGRKITVVAADSSHAYLHGQAFAPGDPVLAFLATEADHIASLIPGYYSLYRVPDFGDRQAETTGESLAELFEDIRWALKRGGDSGINSVIELAGLFRSPELAPDLRQLLPTGSRERDNQVALALLRMGDSAALATLVETIGSPSPMAPGSALAAAVMRELHVANSLPADLSPLTAWTESSNLFLRRAVYSALRRTAYEANVPLLVRGLNDADIDIRYGSVMGLSAIIGIFPNAPSFGRFRENESVAIEFWKKWSSEQDR